MRMWGVNPKYLCDRHLLGEHGEMHKHLPSFFKGYKVERRFTPIIQIQFIGYEERHDSLAEEMLRRGMRHNSPLPELPDFKRLYPEYYHLKVDIDFNVIDLNSRCSQSKEIIEWEVLK